MAMITKRAYDILSSNTPNTLISFRKINDVNSTIWEHLEQLYLGRLKSINDYREYANHYKLWPDRKNVLDALKSNFPALKELEKLVLSSSAKTDL